MNKFIEKINNCKYIQMLREHSLFREHPTLKQIIKFAIVGNLNTIIDFLIYIFLTRGFLFWKVHYLSANSLAFMISICATFDIVRTWIFKLPILPHDEEEAKKFRLSDEEERKIHIQYFRFLFVNFSFFLFNELGLLIFVESFRVNDITSKLLVEILIWFTRFMVHRLWTFKKKNEFKDEKNKSRFLDKIKKNDYFIKSPTLSYAAKYALIGALDCTLDFFLYMFLTRGFPYFRQHYLLANIIAFMTSDAAVFDLGRKWVYHLPVLPKDDEEMRKIGMSPEEERQIHIQYYKYLFVSMTGFSLNEFGLFVCVSLFRLNDLCSKVLMGVFVGAVRLITHKLWTFKQQD